MTKRSPATMILMKDVLDAYNNAAPAGDEWAQDHCIEAVVDMLKREYVCGKRPSGAKRKPCPWPGCTNEIHRHFWACSGHWHGLKPELRNAIKDAYVPGQFITGEIPEAYVRADKEARDWMMAQQMEKPDMGEAQ